MSWSKKATVVYHFINASEDSYFTNLQNSFGAILNSGEGSGSFNSGDTKFVWKLEGVENITDTDTFLVSLVKERASWPVWFNDDGDIASVPLNDGSLGELFYAFINPMKKVMLSMAASSGAAAGSFKKFLNEFSIEGGVKLMPLFENDIDKKTLKWDYYKKVGVSLQFPTYDDLAEFKMTKEGGLLGIIDELGGLKIDINLTAPRQKQTLNSAQVREFVVNLLPYDFCPKLTLRGAEFEDEVTEEYDLKNAQVKYSEMVEIADTFMSKSEARNILLRAFSERAEELLNSAE